VIREPASDNFCIASLKIGDPDASIRKPGPETQANAFPHHETSRLKKSKAHPKHRNGHIYNIQTPRSELRSIETRSEIATGNKEFKDMGMMKPPTYAPGERHS
jgi:hypothetical protein